MRRLPLQAQAFAGVVSVQSIEHVPDPGVVVAEVARVLDVAGVAVFVTPNRLTFGRPEEIIDPWHYIEFDPEQFGDLCRQDFADVTVLGLFGSASYLEFNAHEHRTLDRMLRLDPLRLRRLVSRGVRQRAYDTALNRYRGRVEHPVAAGITIEDFFVADHDLAECLDVIAVCRSPRSAHR
jgi:SAM-dependent methyltransferase